MKAIAGFVGAAILAVIGISVWEFFQQAETQRQMARIATNLGNALVAFVWLTFALAAAAGIAAIAVTTYALIKKRQGRELHNEDGTYRLQTQRLKNGIKAIIDPNKMVGPVLLLDWHGRTSQPEPAAGWDRQQHQNRMVQVTRTVQAATPGDNVLSMGKGHARPSWNLPGVTKARGLQEMHRPDPPGWDAPARPQESAPSLPAPQEHAITLNQMMAGAGDKRWPMGYDKTTGELATIDPDQLTHAMIIGRTGAGKTASYAFLLATQAVRSGWDLLILDGKAGVDWSRWSDRGQWQECDETTIMEQISHLTDEYRRRLQYLRETGCQKWTDIPRGHERPRALVLIEEIGFVLTSLRATSPAGHKTTMSMINNLLRTSRSAGIHMVGVSTDLEGWPSAFKKNAQPLVTYALGPHQGKALQIHDDRPERLEQGQFMVKGVDAVFNSFDLTDQWRNLSRPRSQAPLIPDVRSSALEDIFEPEPTRQPAPAPQQKEVPTPPMDPAPATPIDEKTAAQMFIRSWAEHKTDEEMTVRGAQAGLRADLQNAGLPASKAHVSETLAQIRRERRQGEAPAEPERYVGPATGLDERLDLDSPDDRARLEELMQERDITDAF